MLCGGENNQPGALFVVAGKIVKILFLAREDVGLRDFFAAGKTPQNDGDVGLRGELRAALGVNDVRFAFAALLRMGLRRAKSGDKKRVPLSAVKKNNQQPRNQITGATSEWTER